MGAVKEMFYRMLEEQNFLSNSQIMNDFVTLSEQQFLQKHMGFTQKQYDNTAKQFNQEQKEAFG